MADKSVIESLEIRMRALVDAHRRLDARCRALVVERDRLKAANRTLEERVRGLDAELGRMRLADSLAGGSGDREKARARVNRLMREVDKCIALTAALGDEAVRTSCERTK